MEAGGRATVTNPGDRLHPIVSLPITTHADCPRINAVTALVPGQSRPTGVFTDSLDTFSECRRLLAEHQSSLIGRQIAHVQLTTKDIAGSGGRHPRRLVGAHMH